MKKNSIFIIVIILVVLSIVGYFLIKAKSQEYTWIGIVTEKNDQQITVQVKSDDKLYQPGETVTIKTQNFSIEEPMNVLDLVEKGKSIYDKDYKPSDISKINRDDLLEISSNKILFKISHKKARIMESTSLLGTIKKIDNQTLTIASTENLVFDAFVDNSFKVKIPSQIKKITYNASNLQKSKPVVEDANNQELKADTQVVLIYDDSTKRTISEPKTIVILTVINQSEN